MKLDINFVESNHFTLANTTKLGLAILLMSVFAVACLVYSYQKQFNLYQMAVSTIQKQHVAPTISHENAPNHFSEEVLSQTRMMLSELDMPWDALLNELEQVEVEHLTLLSLEPNLKNKTLTLTGQANNIETALNYVEKLENLPMLSEVYLQKHMVEQTIATKPVSFIIVAKWQS